MCGIATISIGRRCRGRIPYHLLRALSREILIELEPRGLDASGIAVINARGTTPSVAFKKPLRPSRLVVRPKFEEVLTSIDKHTNFVLLHARSTTIGDTGVNYNNHPIFAPPIVGIHNGTLYNHEELFKEFAKHFKAEGDVDSEVIFRLYKHFRDRLEFEPIEAMKATAGKLVGAFTGAIVDLRDPAEMTMFKFERPLSIFRLAHYDIVVAVSEARFYDQAVRRLNITAKEKYNVVKEGTGLIINVNANRITESMRTFNLPVEENYKRSRQLSPWLQAGMAWP